VDLSALTDFSDASGTGSADGQFSVLNAYEGGEIRTGSLENINGVQVVLDRTGTIDVGVVVTLTNGSLLASGNDVSFPLLSDAQDTDFSVDGVNVDLSAVVNLSYGSVLLKNGGTVDTAAVTNIDHTGFTVLDGVTLAFPLVTSYDYASTGSNQNRVLRVEGAGSVLDLSNVTVVTGGASYGSDLHIQAFTGGKVDLSAATGRTRRVVICGDDRSICMRRELAARSI
jgi:hypothetical protein